ncbi:MAG: RNA methyltransferase [Thermoplasmata archaeon]|nr:RNA methyltransferase [Thermoplasmata archaeon]
MPDFAVVLVGPKIPGNIGAVARAMSNFEMDELILVDPCKLEDDAYRFAKHARHIVENATVFDEFEKAIEDLDIVVGTTGIMTENERKFLRQPTTPQELADHLADKNGRVGLIFGREDYGLMNEELARCDILVTIPTSEEYPILNLSHAAAIMFHEVHSKREVRKDRSLADGKEKETLNQLFSELLEVTNYSEHKRAKTKVMLRRIMARADLSVWEFHTLAGVVSRAINSVKRNKQD